MAEVLGGGSKIGRALNIHKKISRDIEGLNGLINVLDKGDYSIDTLKRLSIMDIEELSKLTTKEIQPGFAEYAKAWWYNSTVCPQTHIVNLVSNAAWQLAQVPIKAGRGFIDMPVSRLQNRSREYYVSDALPSMVGLKAGFTSGVAKALQIVKTGIADDATKLTREVGNIAPWTFSPNPTIRKLGPYVEGPTRALQAADALFKGIAFQTELYSLATKQAMKDPL